MNIIQEPNLLKTQCCGLLYLVYHGAFLPTQVNSPEVYYVIQNVMSHKGIVTLSSNQNISPVSMDSQRASAKWCEVWSLSLSLNFFWTCMVFVSNGSHYLIWHVSMFIHSKTHDHQCSQYTIDKSKCYLQTSMKWFPLIQWGKCFTSPQQFSACYHWVAIVYLVVLKCT